jgi:lysophospholipase L1-like esterase
MPWLRFAVGPFERSTEKAGCVLSTTVRGAAYRSGIRLFQQSFLAIAIGVLMATVPNAASVAADRPSCNAPKAIADLEAPLSGLANLVERGREIRIVALGSSSTEGTGASSKQAAYPARFDRAMDTLFPGKDFQVSNLGKGGELAGDMLLRLRRDVIPMKPALVLWQTGVNDAIHGVDLAAFRQTLEVGIAAMKAAGIETVLVDPQFYPKSVTVARYAEFVSAIHQVARAHGVPVFRRYAIMQYLVSSGQLSVDALLWKDKFHLNDVSYACLAELMANAVAAQIRNRATPTTVAQRPMMPAVRTDVETHDF